ncbi:MAG: hydroxymethylbilane synthase [Peptococcaceae bacterium]|jgi:hydroxymethylbilane synthase|nr:hydroxymethylbilane synthase [Peptococcaceae bacterium]MDH7525802.1 hydroxymethylbilane synthase [Peptococcaceae bacterium]
MRKKIRVGTRTSRLALWQAGFVVNRLKICCPAYEFEIIPIVTAGDRLIDVSLDTAGDKGLFTKELELALLNREVDMAVHSMKDYPTEETNGLVIAAVTERHDPREALISKRGEPFLRLPEGTRVGTSSQRRKSQLLHRRPDLQVVEMRGNVDTRLNKLETVDYDAIVLAAAGVERLGLHARITEKLDFSVCLPAAGQGALGVETRASDEETIELAVMVNHRETARCVLEERAFLRALGGGCQVPAGVLAVYENKKIVLQAAVGSPDGRLMLRAAISGEIEPPGELGEALCRQLKSQGAGSILEQARGGRSS